MRSLPEILKEVVKRTGGDSRKLNDIFGAESIRLINALKDSEGRALLDRLASMRGDGSALAGDSARVAGDALGKLTIATTEAKQEADKAMLKHVDTIASGVKDVSRHIESIADFVNDQLWFFDAARREKMAQKWGSIFSPGPVANSPPANTDD